MTISNALRSPALSLLFCASAAFAQSPPAPQGQPTAPAPRAKFNNRVRRIEPNSLAPELYSDKLTAKFTLIDLPGAADPRSTWEGTFKLYFISEAEFHGVTERLMKERAAKEPGAKVFGWNPEPSHFPGKILLAEGSISKKNLATPRQRIFLHENIPFKEKIPAEQRTKGAHLFITYSVKIYDARLKVPVYDSGAFMTYPFDDQTDPEKIAPRTVVYTSFLVSPEGQVWKSSLPRKDGDTSWP